MHSERWKILIKWLNNIIKGAYNKVHITDIVYTFYCNGGNKGDDRDVDGKSNYR